MNTSRKPYMKYLIGVCHVKSSPPKLMTLLPHYDNSPPGIRTHIGILTALDNGILGNEDASVIVGLTDELFLDLDLMEIIQDRCGVCVVFFFFFLLIINAYELRIFDQVSHLSELLRQKPKANDHVLIL